VKISIYLTSPQFRVEKIVFSDTTLTGVNQVRASAEASAGLLSALLA
jgi:hypothetical protein